MKAGIYFAYPSVGLFQNNMNRKPSGLNNNRIERGFTLIELMIVIAIIGILAAIAIPNFLHFQKKGFDSRAKTQAKNYFIMASAYFIETNAETVDVPPGFVADSNVIRIGSFLNDNGVLSETVTFQHVSSATIFTLSHDGSVTP